MAAALAAGLVASPADALDPNREISQYLHDHWGVEEGFPGGAVYAFAQTPDGYLWIGAEKGLVRFDGLGFLLFDPAKIAELPASPVLGLEADAEGGLWIRLQSPGLLRYHDGVFAKPLPDVVNPGSGVTAMCRGPEGEVLLTRPGGTQRYANDRLEPLAAPIEPFTRLVISMAQTADGKTWLGTRDAGLYFLSQGRVSAEIQGVPDAKINSLLPGAGGELWIGTDKGMVRWDGTAATQVGIPPGLQQTQVLAMAHDRESNIWIGSGNGLLRLNADGVSTPGQADAPSTAVTALFEDREGNLWVGGPQGFDRYRDRAFLTYLPEKRLSSENNGPIYTDDEGRTWFAPSSGGLFWLRGSQMERVSLDGLDQDVVYSIAGGPGELWVGRQRGGLTHLRYDNSSFTAETYTEANGLAQNSVYAVYRSRDGTVWAGTLSAGLGRFRRGKFTTFTVDGLVSNAVTAIAEGSDGTMWFATPSGLHALSDEQWRVYAGAAGLPPGGVNCLSVDSSGVLWIGTGAGMAFLEADRIQMAPEAPAALQDQILGITEDRNRALWIATASRVLRVDSDKLRRGAVAGGDLREYGIADGLESTVSIKRYRSVVADSRGRIWFSMNRGLSVVDPGRLVNDSPPALVHVETILADGNSLARRPDVRVPAGTQRITFRYAGLSLAVPERVRFRYMLNSFDQGWSEPAATRQAVYTNLGPGSYTFRVMASNADGVWNSAEASLAFTVEPAFWQTWWFRLGGVLTFVLAAAALYRFRVHQVTRKLNVRFEERLAERTRIAQELHDTLLQGFLSASMQLHVAADKVPEESPAKPSLNRVLSLMGQVIDEGRNAVRGLRSSHNDSCDLEEAFSRIEQELGGQGEISYRVIVEGRTQALHPILRDEVYRIGREAVVNAFRHAQAKNIEIEIEYGLKRFRFLVRDDGCGIDPKILESGRDGHWGLPGMRERAERIGGKLSVWSRASAGTEVELSVPSHVAFQSLGANASPRWFARLGSGAGSVNDGPSKVEKHK